MKNILFIHQSAELYGSDKTLLYLVISVKNQSNYNPIVVLPTCGPLKEKLEAENIEVILTDVVKVSRGIFKPKQLISLFFLVKQSVQSLHKKLKGREIHVVHSNTLAVLLGAFYSKKHKINHLWHVHEIIENPKIVKNGFTFLLNKFSKVVVYNSKTTMDFWTQSQPKLRDKSVTILNGLNRKVGLTSPESVNEIRSNLFAANPSDIVLGLIGRINNWKGQSLLLDAFAELRHEFHNIKLVFVGSTAQGQEQLRLNLEQEIQKKKLQSHACILPFQQEIYKIWDSIDIAVVPSTKPEPFGLVAIEAMLAQKPLIAANHGGLVEIVKDNVTGFLFEPRNVVDLIEKLKILLNDSYKRKKFGENGKRVAEKDFSLNSYAQNFYNLYEKI